MKKYTLKRTAETAKPESFSIDYRADLNDEQYRAATYGDGPSLVIAGAGSGKTRTLIYRVAYLIETGVFPPSILLLTFTRKAAQQMLARAAALTQSRLDAPSGGVSGGTFHSFAATVLREFSEQINYSPSFSILDRSDSDDVINLMRTRMNLDTRERRFPKKKTIGDIFSMSINRSISLKDAVEGQYSQFTREIDALYELWSGYIEYKKKHMLMDYDDLLVHLVRLLEESDSTRRTLSSRYRYILVDEYQDTNSLQAKIISLLSDTHKNVMAVGDDSQSIYSFRGADFQNIMRFPELFDESSVITLERNYRSTQPILTLANTIIDRAEEKYTKILFTKKSGGVLPALVPLPDESAQSRFVAQRILDLREEGVELDDIAVLFRAGFNSFDLEIELKNRNIPFIKYGGFKFMETAHVKDVIAHIRAATNPNDIVSINRMLLLVEGIGPQAAQKIAAGFGGDAPASRVLASFSDDRRFGAGAVRLSGALSFLEREKIHPVEAIERIIEYISPILKKKYDDHPKRLQDLEHLAVISHKYGTMEEFLTDMALEPPSDSISDITPEDPDPERLILSTVHSAKGLEWHSVFVIWAAEGYFPTTYSAESQAELEEELRLMYVAVTRAKENLAITYPVKIMTHRGPTFARPSRFINDIDSDILEPWVVEEEWD